MNEKDNNESVNEENFLTTDSGTRINHTDDSLKAGDRGPIIMEDFHFREKMTHFDHERIPERVVHARGSGAHGYFQVYENMKAYTKAKFLQDPSVKTPVFVRFSTVVGFRGSADTVRDVRGFATKFYTEDGNYDLVGNNMAPFFIQDAIKFPDVVHAIKPEPHHEMPQASAAHDNFWDFASLVPETLHMLMWVLSDRAFPRSYSMMEGFGVHTFRFVNDEGKSRFVKFHWKPVNGVYSVLADEAQIIAGKDPDYNRRDLWEAIENGIFPEYELAVQMIEQEDEHKFAFDILDATKIWPEELVPLKKIGKMTLNRNPDNFFLETEQIAFHPGRVVAGIDFTNDPLLQGRLFSYLDTQLTRLGGPNFDQIPINRPHVAVNNNQQDGFMRQENMKGRTNYTPNSLGGGCPMHTPEQMQGYVHYPQKVEGEKIRERSKGFKDFYSQATLFWNSMSAVEKKHMIDGFQFELSNVKTLAVRERMVWQLVHVDGLLAKKVAEGIGVDPPSDDLINKIQTEVNEFLDKLWDGRQRVMKTAFLSQENLKKNVITGRKVAILAADGASTEEILKLKDALLMEKAMAEVVSLQLGMLKGSKEVNIDKTFSNTASVVYDAVFIAGGKDSIEMLKKNGKALHFINEAYNHCKPIGAIGEGVNLLKASFLGQLKGFTKNNGAFEATGIITAPNWDPTFMLKFRNAVSQHRFWNREEKDMVPA